MRRIEFSVKWVYEVALSFVCGVMLKLAASGAGVKLGHAASRQEVQEETRLFNVVERKQPSHYPFKTVCPVYLQACDLHLCFGFLISEAGWTHWG